jgi:FAD/FMN-containing dehydrogenase
MRDFLIDLLGADNVLQSAEDLAPYREDFTEIEAVEPAAVAFVRSVEEVQAVVRRAAQAAVPITPRVAGTNVGGLALASPGGIVLDLSRMNRIVEVHAEDMVAVIEPVVTQQQMKDHLIERDLPLTLGYSLAPPNTSIFANALLGGLTNRSLKYGDQSQWIAGLEVVLADGQRAKLGSWALSDLPFSQVPFPGLCGLFTGWQATTGIAVRMAFQLWPRHPLNKRLFILADSARGTFEAVRRLTRTEICDDIGGLSWPTGKMLLGVKRPNLEPEPGEPSFFLYVDLTAEIDEEMAAKEKILLGVLTDLRRQGEALEDPLDIQTLVRLNPAMSAFAEFPTELTFLTDHGGGGLSWIGTYGPMSRFEAGIEGGTRIMKEHGFPPIIVTRPMRGGHFGVLRFVTIFDKGDPTEVERVRAVNAALLDRVTELGFVMYKTPAWAWERLAPRMDAGMLELLRRTKEMMDPRGIFNPGKLGF